ncbi:MAG: ribonuclease Z [Muribaculaceae bacterium]|nr:ribonuclease Z [Muribaculaceae bacterium]
MSQFSVNILGCGSATPTAFHNPSSQVIDFRGNLMMVDCGEGAQAMMRRMRLKFSRLSHIFISHLHGDHFFGLPGLLSTMALHEKSGTVTIHAFEAGLEVLRKTMAIFCPDPGYEIVYDPIKYTDATIIDTDALTVETVRLSHRVPCVGFVFREKTKSRHINGEMVRFYNVPTYKMNALKAGEDYTMPDGTVIANHRLTFDPDPAMSYAYLSDTAYNPALAEKVRGLSLMFHEATYSDIDENNAAKRGHSTARQAAMLARKAEAGQLMLGHFSKRYNGDEELLLTEAREVFPDTILAKEGLKVELI